MAKIPVILEAGRADGKLIKTDSIFDENKGMFQSEINDIQDTLNSDNPNKPLSAKQGKVLKELLDAKVIEAGDVPIDTEPTEGNITHVVSSDGIKKELNKLDNKVDLANTQIDCLKDNIGVVFCKSTILESAYAGINYDVDIEEGDTYSFVVNTDNVPLYLIAYPDKNTSSYETIKNINTTGTSHIIWTADKHYNRIRLYKDNNTDILNIEYSILKGGLTADIIKNSRDISTLNSTVSTNKNDIQCLKDTIGTPLFSQSNHITDAYSQIAYGKLSGSPVIFSNKEYIIEFSNNAVQSGLRFLAYTDSTDYDIIFTNQFGEKTLVFKPTKDYIHLKYQQTVAQEVDASMTIWEKNDSILIRLIDKINKGEVGTDDIINGSITNDKLSSDFHFPKVEITDLSEDTIIDSDLSYNIYNPTTVAQGKFINKNTGLPTHNNSIYETSDYIEVKEGQPYYLGQLGSDYSLKSNDARFISFWDADKKKVGDVLQDITMRGYVIPSGVKYIMITCNSTTVEGGTVRNILLYKGTEEKPFRPYGDNKYYFKEDLIEDATIAESKLTLDVQRKLNLASVDVKPASMTVRGNLDGTNTFEIPKNSIKNCKGLSFTGTLVNWGSTSKLSMGFGKTDYLSGWIEIDNTNLVVKYHTTTDSVKSTTAHGLTLANNIQVNLYKDWTTTTINITSNGTTYTHTITNMIGENGIIFATLENGVINDCTFSFYSDSINYENWLFGDSYFTTSSADRWTNYLRTNNHLRNLLNAYSGENDASALTDLKNLLQMGTPKRIIWCEGMNDSDSKLDNPTTTPNASWMNTINELKEICYVKGIELILSTIPCVFGGYSEDTGQSSSRYHKAKNDYVRASGYRYIDFDKAVGASNTTGLWYGTTREDIINKTGNGMLSSDGVHPTDKGAKTLYAQAVADVPELMTIKL